jgi:hypothetical protein
MPRHGAARLLVETLPRDYDESEVVRRRRSGTSSEQVANGLKLSTLAN